MRWNDLGADEVENKSNKKEPFGGKDKMEDKRQKVSEIKTHYNFSKEIIIPEKGRCNVSLSVIAPFEHRIELLNRASESMKEWVKEGLSE